MGLEVNGGVSFGRGIQITSERPGMAVAVTYSSSPYLSVYPFTSQDGFGTKYSNPTSPPGSGPQRVSFHPDGTAIAVTQTSSPYVNIYSWTSTGGFGTRYSDPAGGYNGAAYGVGFSTTGGAIGIGFNSSPRFRAWAWNSSTGFGTEYSLTSPGSGTWNSVAFGPGSLVIAGGTTLAYYYSWNDSTGTGGSGSGTYYQQTLPSTANDIAISPVGGTIALVWDGGGQLSPRVQQFDAASHTPGSVYTEVVGGEAFTYGVAWSPDSSVVAVAKRYTPFIAAWPFNYSTGIGTKYSDPSTLPPNEGNKIKFSADGKAVFLAHIGSPFITAYRWDNSTGFGAKYADPSSLPTNTANDLSVVYAT